MTIAGRDCRSLQHSYDHLTVFLPSSSGPSPVAGLLVYVQSDVVHVVSEEPPRLFSESAWPLSSAPCNTSCSSSTQHSNNPAATRSMRALAFHEKAMHVSR